MAETAEPFWKRLMWMAAIWAGGGAVLGVLAAALRFWLRADPPFRR